MRTVEELERITREPSPELIDDARLTAISCCSASGKDGSDHGEDGPAGRRGGRRKTGNRCFRFDAPCGANDAGIETIAADPR